MCLKQIVAIGPSQICHLTSVATVFKMADTLSSLLTVHSVLYTIEHDSVNLNTFEHNEDVNLIAIEQN